MPTSYTVHENNDWELSVYEISGTYDLDLWNKKIEEWTFGVSNMSPEETINLALNILYAVWCANPEQVDELLTIDIVKKHSELQKERLKCL